MRHLENLVSKFKIVIHSVILATTPSFLVYPQETPLHADFHVQTVHSRKLKKNYNGPRNSDQGLSL